MARKRQELAGRGMGRRVRTRGMPGFTVFFVAIVLAFNAGLTFYYHHRALEAQSKGAGAAPARNAELKARADAVQAAASLRDSVPIETVTSRNVSVVSWDALSQILLDVYASFLGSELKATMHKALVELGPDPKALKSARYTTPVPACSKQATRKMGRHDATYARCVPHIAGVEMLVTRGPAPGICLGGWRSTAWHCICPRRDSVRHIPCFGASLTRAFDWSVRVGKIR